MAIEGPLTIIGGGPAGLALGIALRRKDIPVSVIEAGRYPRHKVCGEFISGRGLACLREWNLLELFETAGARPISRVGFFARKRLVPLRHLPERGLALSRFRLDHALASRFIALGGTLEEGKRWSGDFAAEGIVRATGRQACQTRENSRWVGLKVHACDLPMETDLEMHLRADAYVGLCRVEGGWVNVCGLFRANGPMRGLAGHWKQFLEGAGGAALHDRLERADFQEQSFSSVAGLSFGPWHRRPGEGCGVGDALGMVPPLTGNGLSMAFESAALAAEPLTSYSRGQISWADAVRTVGDRQSARFRSRFYSGAFLHKLIFQRRSRPLLVLLGVLCWPFLFWRTR